ncbi:hypothetical protein [Tenuibacillus multivorans]|uniref:Uncharacterized protein n=1 Tax=Tenuibacillus multivorans TaxID=237069 RepID=A0A1G9ZZ15_9BACI|nr:hypothetical protein [Tenuibacillus multivorans]GEL76901.1 hypothetical protein TMU01_11360 [Tenuibacillus multivorans]SDN26375.1 hypothetical protein SAMN05216498_1893 [Tenuibacillus multivorans]
MKKEPIKGKKRQEITADTRKGKFTDKARKKAEADRHTRGGF